MNKTHTISKVLKLKENRKKEFEIEVKKLHDRVDEEEDRLNAFKREYEEKRSSFDKKAAKGSMDVRGLNSYYDVFACIDYQIEEQKEICLERVKELEAMKKRLLEAHKEEKMFEIMKDKQIRTDKKQKADLEQKENDFLAMTRKVK